MRLLSHTQGVLFVNTMPVSTEPLTYRNFNLCPHCIFQGEQALLCRLSEGMPMISRSDGRRFHLLLADRPAPYPARSESELSTQVSLCFWYSHVLNVQETASTVVILRKPAAKKSALFREIDAVADCLADLLAGSKRIAGMYEFADGSLAQVGY
jgi:hypothetical protein